MKSKTWPRYPAIYEINTWVWLAELGAKYGDFIELGSVPDAEWDAIAEYGFDAVWLMGVWERSPAAIALANRNAALLEGFRRALPDFHPLDNVGSPYSVRRYEVDQLIGGREGLAMARKELARRGMRLILDFVPNHVAPDHSWAVEHPEYFIQGSLEDLQRDPESFLRVGDHVIARGRDPYFPAWPDVLQLNGFDRGLRQAAEETVANIAPQCDGIRCDMAMLLENPIFERTWDGRAGQRPGTEYWADLIPAIKRRHPNFLFIAEAYWDREWELQQQGFDFCYDGRLYERLEHDTAESVRMHLRGDPAYQEKLIRFIENHDEPRAAASFSPAKEMAAALLMATAPGARLFHEGQFEGRKVKLPVFLDRRPAEGVDKELQSFYRTLLKVIEEPIFHDGEWTLCEQGGWPDDRSYENLVAWCWEKDDRRRLVVVNLSDQKAQARVRVPWNDMSGETWRLNDALSGATYDCEGDEIGTLGLYVGLGPWNFHLFECRRSRKELLASAA
ncbi:MAG: alpha-amylase family glycosyl hydrolase [Candidatus Solibacter sp.]